MNQSDTGRVAIVCSGDREARRKATKEESRFADLFVEFEEKGTHAELAIYHDHFCAEVQAELLKVDAVLVWVNPIQDGNTRSILDQMLKRVAAAGIFISTHPELSGARSSRGLWSPGHQCAIPDPGRCGCR